MLGQVAPVLPRDACYQCASSHVFESCDDCKSEPPFSRTKISDTILNKMSFRQGDRNTSRVNGNNKRQLSLQTSRRHRRHGLSWSPPRSKIKGLRGHGSLRAETKRV